MSREDALEDRSKAIVPFVLRARSVANHSLVVDQARLKGLSAIRLTSVVHPPPVAGDSPAPAEAEAIESLLLRLRPIILEDDGASWTVATKAMLRIAQLRSDDEMKRSIDRLRHAWEQADPRRDSRFFDAGVLGPETPDGTFPMMWGTQLALGWLYANGVHADQVREAQLSGYSVDVRFAMATRYALRLAWMTVQTLRVIERLQAVGWLNLPSRAFEEQVVAGGGPGRLPVLGSSAGAVQPSLEQPFPEGFLVGLPMIMDGVDIGLTETFPNPPPEELLRRWEEAAVAADKQP